MNPVTIIGGGLAGLALGIALRQRDVPTTILEAGHYPRHRVCGEFISGKGRGVLGRLGLERRLFDAGGSEGRTAAFFSGRCGGRVTELPEPALCVSRYILDEMLATEFRQLGGCLHENERSQKFDGDGIVHATGRRTETSANGWRWFGLKVHVRDVQLTASLELHLLPNGYVGLCQVDSKTVNVCGLFRSRTPVPDLSRNWRNWLEGTAESSLHRRLSGAEFCPETFCSVAGLSLRPQAAAGHGSCRIGDAITMIAPLTGNGMSMALESAELAAAPLISYSDGKTDWKETVAEIATRCDRAFAQRLRWSHWLQKAFFTPSINDALVWLGSRAPVVWRGLFARTR